MTTALFLLSMLTFPFVAMLFVGRMISRYFVRLPPGYPQIRYLMAVVTSALSFVCSLMLWIWLIVKGRPDGILPALILTLVWLCSSAYVRQIAARLKEPEATSIGLTPPSER